MDIIINNLPNDVKQCFKLFYNLYPPVAEIEKTHITGTTEDIMKLMITLKYTPNMKIEYVEAFLNRAGYKKEPIGTNEDYACWITGVLKKS